MATYSELSTIQDGAEWNGFLNRVRVACTIKAAAILDSVTPTQSQLDWANATIKTPNQSGQDIVFYVIAKNSGATLNQIYTATDAAIQTNVNAAVDALTGV